MRLPRLGRLRAVSRETLIRCRQKAFTTGSAEVHGGPRRTSSELRQAKIFTPSINTDGAGLSGVYCTAQDLVAIVTSP
jgi:hypothetical protein